MRGGGRVDDEGPAARPTKSEKASCLSCDSVAPPCVRRPLTRRCVARLQARDEAGVAHLCGGRGARER